MVYKRSHNHKRIQKMLINRPWLFTSCLSGSYLYPLPKISKDFSPAGKGHQPTNLALAGFGLRVSAAWGACDAMWGRDRALSRTTPREDGLTNSFNDKAAASNLRWGTLRRNVAFSIVRRRVLVWMTWVALSCPLTVGWVNHGRVRSFTTIQ